jgi:AcrR family transcriptional regulator
MAEAEIVPTRHSSAPLVPATPRGEATRRRLLDAAEEVFGEMGYYEASVSEITRRAGVAQGTFYIYFHSKRETFVELVEDISERLRRATRAAIRDTTGRVEAERRGFEAFFRFVYEHRRIYRIVEEAGRVAPEAAREYYRRIGLGYEHGLASAMERGQIRPGNVEGLAYALMGIGHFLALRWLIWPIEEEAARQVAQPGAQPDTGATPEPSLPMIPDAVFQTVMDFIARGLEGDPPQPQP